MRLRADVPAKQTKAKKLSEKEIAGKLVTQPEFLDHLNQVVFEPVLGVELSREAAKSLVDGIAQQVAFIALARGSVRLGDLGTFSVRVSKNASTRLPLAGQDSDPMRVSRLSFRSSQSTKRMVKDAKLHKVDD